MPMPGAPPMPPGAMAPPGGPPAMGSPAPPGAASPMAPKQGGQEARGRVMAGLGLELLRMAIPLFGNSPDGQAIVEVVAKLGKKFVKPPADLGAAELKFMGSQLGQGGPKPAGPGGGMPPPPPPPPGAAPAPGAEGGA